MRSGRFVILILAALLCSVCQAQGADYRTRTFHPAFHTLRVAPEHSEFAPPVIVLGGDERLVISFDELSTDRRYMRYELFHCDYLGVPDRLVPSEYIDGFNEGVIDDYEYSRATTVHYINYRLMIPNPDMNIRLSGNYLLRVYDETDPEKTLLQVRFSVVEPLVKIATDITTRTDVDYNDAHQQLSIAVDTERARINNVFTDLKMVVSQNSRTDNVVVVEHPMRVAGSKLYYEHLPQLIFPAGNEYRRMEIVSTTYPGMHVDKIGFMRPFYHATLYVDEPRAANMYLYDRTQHGKYRIREFNSDDSDVEADYMLVHFALDAPQIHGYDVFIDSEATHRIFGPDSRMVFNHGTGLYEATLFLKQGAYNYQYLAVPSGSQKGETRLIEGDKYQTVNEYSVAAYYRAPGERYDRLIGFAEAFSGE